MVNFYKNFGWKVIVNSRVTFLKKNVKKNVMIYSNKYDIKKFNISSYFLNEKTSLLYIIEIKKNSKGLKNKNTYKFLNKPLIQHTIDYARNTKGVTDIVVSTDDPKSAYIAKKINV